MTQVELFPCIAAVTTVVGVVYMAITSNPTSKHAWIVPAGLCALFLSYSLLAAFVEGPAGFWTHHIQDRWGNQVWFDLLLGVSAALAFMIPRARQMEMRVLPWVLLTLATGSIGLYAFMSRLHYLESQKSRR